MSVQVPLFEKGDKKSSKVAAKVEEIVGGGFDVGKFVENFETIVHAVGGIRSLRKLVLELAIRGRLSIRQEGDGTARRLFDAATADRLARQGRGEARQMEELAEPGSDEVPFSLPSTWLWTRIGLAANLVNGRAFKPKDWSASGLPIIRIQNLNNPNAGYNYCAFAVEAKHHLSPGDFLISWSGTPGTSFGAFIWHGPAGVLNQHIFRAEVYAAAYELGFLRIAINARLDEMIAQAHGGVGLQHITKGKLEALAIPLPPLAEQKRIVAKVDQLMALCDELEAKQTKKRETGARLTKSALDALTSAEGPDEFDAAWKRVVENFDVLIDRAEKVGELRRALLRLAVHGAFSQKKREEWTVATVAEVADCRLGKMLDKVKNRGTPRAYLRNTNVHWFRLDLSDIKEMLFEDDECEEYELRPGDLVVCEGGHGIGRTTVWAGERKPMMFQKALHRLRPRVMMNSWFLAFQLKVAADTGVMDQYFTGAGIPHLTGRRLAEMTVVVPPVSEQEQIVAKVKELMKICDELEVRLEQAEVRASQLVEAVVQEVVAAGPSRPAC